MKTLSKENDIGINKQWSKNIFVSFDVKSTQKKPVAELLIMYIVESMALNYWESWNKCMYSLLINHLSIIYSGSKIVTSWSPMHLKIESWQPGFQMPPCQQGSFFVK